MKIFRRLMFVFGLITVFFIVGALLITGLVDDPVNMLSQTFTNTSTTTEAATTAELITTTDEPVSLFYLIFRFVVLVVGVTIFGKIASRLHRQFGAGSKKED